MATTRTQFRNLGIVKEQGLFRGAATTMLNRNFMQLKSLQYKELQRRLARARLFLKTRLPGDTNLQMKTLEEIEDVWRAELDAYTIEDFKRSARAIPRGLSDSEKDLLKDSEKEDCTQLLIRQFVLEKCRGPEITLPPSDSLAQDAISFCICEWPFPPGNSKSALDDDETPPWKRDSSREKLFSSHASSSTDVSNSASPLRASTHHAPNRKDPWLNPALVKIWLTTQILDIRMAAGDNNVVELVTDDAELPRSEQSRVFREQYGWSPRWDEDVTSETTLRTRHVASEVVSILGKRDILAADRGTWMTRFLLRENLSDRPPSPPPRAMHCSPDSNHPTSHVGALHQHLIGPISFRRCKARGEQGVAMLEKQMPCPGDPPPQTARWVDVHMHKLADPFNLQPSAIRPMIAGFSTAQGATEASTSDARSEKGTPCTSSEGQRGVSGTGSAGTPLPLPSAKQQRRKTASSHGRQHMRGKDRSTVAQVDSMVARLTHSFDIQLENASAHEVATREWDRGGANSGRGGLRVDIAHDHFSGGCTARFNKLQLCLC